MHQDFINIIKDKGYKKGAELGVKFGSTSRQIFEQCDLEKYIGIDITWQVEAAKLYKESEFGEYIIGNTNNAYKMFDDEMFDFIYVDAAHTYLVFSEDLKQWWPKVKPGGMFFGDDYLVMTNPVEGIYGVVSAVEEKFEDKVLLLHHEYATTREERFDLAVEHGKKAEDNLFLAHSYALPEEVLRGRERHEDDYEILNWYLFKE